MESLPERPFNWTCPYCDRHVTVTDENCHESYDRIDLAGYPYTFAIVHTSIACPNPDCGQVTLTAALVHLIEGSDYRDWAVRERLFDWNLLPRSVRKPQPEYIPKEIKEDYEEACLTMSLSPKASATLSRRCLHSMINDYWGINEDNLAASIKNLQERVDEDVWHAIDGVRRVGRVGAHMTGPIGQIVEVDQGEAKTLIELIELLFREWYVARHNRKGRLAKMRALGEQKDQQRADAKAAQKEAQQSSQPVKE